MENIFWRTSNLSTDFKTGHVMTMFSYVYGLAANNLPSIRNATVRLIEAFESAISRHNVSTVNHVHLRGVLLPIIMKLHNLQEFGFPLYVYNDCKQNVRLFYLVSQYMDPHWLSTSCLCTSRASQYEITYTEVVIFPLRLL